MRVNGVLAKKQQPATPYDTTLPGVCGQCAAGCGLKVHKGGAAVDFFGDEDHPVNKGALCPKALNLYEARRHPLRLQKPCIRKSVHDPWQETSWDAALDEIVRRLEDRGGAAGSSRIAAFPAGRHDPFDYYMGAAWFASLISPSASPSQFQPAALGAEGGLAAMFGLPGSQLLMNPPRDWALSGVTLLVGGDAAAEEPVSFGPLQDARDRGHTLLYLGAVGGMTALRCSEAMLVRPGTESAALAGLVRAVLDKGWTDAAFVAENTVGIETLRERVGAYTPERVASLCGVSVEQFERFARILGRTFPIQVQAGFPGRLWPDDWLLELCGALVALRGSIGVPGGGLNLHGVSPFRGVRCTSDEKKAPALDLEEFLAANRAAAVFGFGDWASRLAGGSVVRRALAECPLVLHMGSFADATRDLATISLPAAHWSEYECLVDVNSGRALQWRPAMLDVVGESRAPLDIWTDLARRFKAGATPPWESEAPAGESTPQRRLAAYALANEPLTRGIALADLESPEQKGGVLWPCPEGSEIAFERSRYIRGTVRGHNILFEAHNVFSGGDNRFPTADGKIHLEALSVLQPQNGSSEPQPVLLLRQEAGKSFNHPDPVRAGKRFSVARMHPESARRLHLQSGQKVRVKTAAGDSVEAVLQALWSVPQGGVALDPEAGACLIPLDKRQSGSVPVFVDPA